MADGRGRRGFPRWVSLLLPLLSSPLSLRLWHGFVKVWRFGSRVRVRGFFFLNGRRRGRGHLLHDLHGGLQLPPLPCPRLGGARQIGEAVG